MLPFIKPLFLFEENDGAGSGAGDSGNTNDGDNRSDDGNDTAPKTFDAWLDALPEDQKKVATALYSESTSGLKRALEDERTSRQQIEGDLREMAKKAEKGSEAQKELTKLADAMATATAKSDFYEEAVTKGVSNIKLAFVVANEDKLIDGRGRVNWEGMKESYPELFGSRVAPKSNAGSGTGTDHQPTGDMNNFIRQAAGHNK